jgi:hypothetical protein
MHNNIHKYADIYFSAHCEFLKNHQVYSINSVERLESQNNVKVFERKKIKCRNRIAILVKVT